MSSYPALAVKPPEPGPSALDMYRQMIAIKGAQQQQAIQNVSLQQQQMALKDQQTLRTLFIKNQGNLDKVIQDAPQAGVSPQTIQQLQLHNIDVKTKTADLVQKQGANAQVQADLMQGAHDAVDKAPPEQKPAIYQQQLQALQQRGIDVSQVPQQYPGDDQFKMLGAVVQGHKQQVEDAFKQSEAAKNTAQAGEATAATAKSTAALPATIAEGQIKQAEAAAIQQGGMNKEMADAKYLGLQTRAKQGIPISPPDKAFMAAYEKQKTLVPTATFNLQNAGATGQPGQPSAMARALADGSLAWKDAVSPRTPMNIKTELLAEVKSINPNFKSSDFEVEKKVQEKYTSGSAADQLTAINTAREHMATFKQTAAALDNGNFKLANNVGNWLGTQFGSDKATNFNVARSAFAGEVGKAFAGANVGVSDRQELIDKINQASSFEQLKGYADTADKLLEGKQKSLKEGFTQGMQGKPNFGTQSSGMVTMQAPNGQTKQVPADQVEHYKSMGAKVVNQ